MDKRLETARMQKSQNQIGYGIVILTITVLLLVLWPNLLENILVSTGFMPHGHCYLWKPQLVWLHLISDTLIGLSYVSISATLTYLVHRTRRDIPFEWIFLAFGLFIVACGITHFMEVWTLWTPTYWLAGEIKLITAIASVTTAIILPPLVPKVLGLLEVAKLSQERKSQLEIANAELEVLYEKLKEVDRLKTEFFANISHELRTPLTLILGPTEKLLGDEKLNDEYRQDLKVINRNALTLLKHVNDLLDVSKLEAGKMAIDYAEVDVAQILRLTCSHFKTLAADRQIAFSVETPEILKVQIDIEKLERVCFNLVSNAFKFTPDGGTINCKLNSDTLSLVNEPQKLDPAGTFTIAIEDSGPGVPPDLRSAIFERFRQGEDNSNRRFGGTGLGLAIVKDFVELHGGTIAVNESLIGGASFTVKIPILAPSGINFEKTAKVTTTTEQVASQILSSLTNSEQSSLITNQILEPEDETFLNRDSLPLVLVVEDNLEMNRFITQILTPEYRIANAFNGQEGLEKTEQLRPDLILSDVMMPQLSGDRLVEELRKRPELDNIPIILLSAKADDDLRVHLLKTGVQDYVMKPFSAEELRARVKNLVSMKQARDIFQQDLQTKNHDLATLAKEVSDRQRQLQKLTLELEIRVEERTKELAQTNALLKEEVVFRVQAQAQLEKEQEFLKILLENLEAGIVACDENGVLTLLNRAAREFHNLPVEPIAAEKWADYYDLYLPDSQTRMKKEEVPLFQALQGKQVHNLEMAIVPKQGKSRTLLSSGQAILNSQGQKLGAVVVMHDITARKQAEEALRQSQSTLRSFFDSASMMMGVVELVDDDIRHISDNLAASKLFGLTPEAMQNKLASEMGVSDAHRQMWINYYRQAEEAKGPVRFEYCHQTEHGSWWIASTVCAIATSADQPPRFAYVVEDISDRKQAEEAIRKLNAELETRVIDRTAQLEAANSIKDELLQREQSARLEAEKVGLALAESEARYRAIGESIPFGVWISDRDGKIIYFSDSFLQLINMTLEEAKHFGWTKRLPPENVDKTIATWNHCIENSDFWDYEYKIKGNNGQDYTILSRGVPVRDRFGQINCWVGINLDITELSKLQDALRQQTEELQQASRMKDEFLTILSHELRTPLNAVLAWATLLRTRNLDQAKKAIGLETIERNAKKQTQLIEDLLDVSQTIRGQLEISIAPVDLSLVISAAVKVVKLTAETRAIELNYIQSPSTVMVAGDANRLQQVIWNLLSNAIKFTPIGGRVEIKLLTIVDNISPKISHGNRQPINNYAQIQVNDTGIGISAEFMPFIFDRFRQANSSTIREYGGLGLGLSIVRHIVELHGGTVRAESKGEGQGTSFIVQLPLLSTKSVYESAKVYDFSSKQQQSLNSGNHSRRQPGKLPSATLFGLQVLVVDDEPDNLQVLSAILEQSGAKVTAVKSVAEALAALENSQPDVLVSDIGMPGEDGYSLIRQIRSKEAERGGRLRAIALSAYTTESDGQRALDTGFDKYIPKPVQPAQLITVIARLTGRLTKI